jgi:hypothetical protein
MRGVLQLALVYFSVVPLHRWVSLVGAALMVFSIVLAVSSSSMDALSPALLGAGILAMGPVLLGGGMHRHASSRTLMHLRPNGRLRMLLAATLAVTLLAAIAMIPALVSQAIPSPATGTGPFREMSPFATFAFVWSLAALMWAGTFITGASHLQGLLFGFLPLLLLKFGKALAIVLPPAPVVLAASIIAWAAFGLWYTHVRSLRQMPSYGDRTTESPAGTAAAFLQSRFGSARGTMSLAGAMNQYLLGACSPGGYALVLGLSWVLLPCTALLVLANFVFPASESAVARLVAQLIFLPLFMITNASLGFSLTRRARLLWLRPGQDRASLFERAERSGLLISLLPLGIAATAFLAFSLASWPERATAILFFGGAQLTFALCLFYCGLSLTRGWAAVDVLLCLALCILFPVELVVFRPWNEQQPAVAAVLGAMLLLVPLLRWHARRRWHALDWHIARMLNVRRPT